MNKKMIIIAVALGLLLVTALAIFFMKNFAHRADSQKTDTNASIKVVNVDKLISAPERYQGFLGAEGTVLKVDKAKDVFLLGCEDACISMPVKFKGQMPAPESEIIVYGEIKREEDGRFIFQGEQVKIK